MGTAYISLDYWGAAMTAYGYSPQRIGFTGTRAGMSAMQKKWFAEFVACHYRTFFEFHHGDCIGADAEAHIIVRKRYPTMQIVLHPPEHNGARAYSLLDPHTRELPVKPFMVRNRAIVDACDTLVVMPRTADPGKEHRSGTWATYRYAMKEREKFGTPAVMLVQP